MVRLGTCLQLSLTYGPDTEVIDVTLTQNMSMFMISCSWYFAGVGVMASILPWTLFGIIPVTGLYMVLLLHCK